MPWAKPWCGIDAKAHRRSQSARDRPRVPGGQVDECSTLATNTPQSLERFAGLGSGRPFQCRSWPRGARHWTTALLRSRPRAGFLAGRQTFAPAAVIAIAIRRGAETTALYALPWTGNDKWGTRELVVSIQAHPHRDRRERPHRRAEFHPCRRSPQSAASPASRS